MITALNYSDLLLYRHGSSAGMGHLVDTIAHAAIWSIVGRIVWHAPVIALVVIAAAAGYWLLRRRTGGR